MGRRWVIAAMPLVALVALAACTDGGGGIPTASSSRPPASGPPAGTSIPSDDLLERERQFIACMRGEGIEMSDPIPGDTSGRSALLNAIDVKGQGNFPAFQAALERCATFLPPQEKPPPPAPDRLAQLRAYAQCMRDNGVSDFPDPDPQGGWTGGWIRADDKVAMAAAEKCRHNLPPDA